MIGLLPMHILRPTLLIMCIICCLFTTEAQLLTNSTSIQITRSWSQEPSGWTYPVSIHVPSGTAPQNGYPVLVALHGNGGNGANMLNQYRNLLDCHIIVCPSGYQSSWNICDENSDAPDIDMLSELITTLQTYTNVDVNRIRLLGSSNGSALTNRAFIELQNSGIDTYVGIVSQLNVPQFHMGDFYGPSSQTDANLAFCGYDSLFSAPTNVRYLSICNTNDPIIPYNGGTSVVGVDFIPAPVATHILAQSQGYTGAILTGPGTQIGSSTVYEYSYLNDQVVLLKGEAFHGLDSNQINYMVDFLDDCNIASSNYDIEPNNQFNVYPNPTNQFVTIRTSQPNLRTQYFVRDVYGQQWLHGEITQDDQQIDLSSCPSGVLLFQLGSQMVVFVKM